MPEYISTNADGKNLGDFEAESLYKAQRHAFLDTIQRYVFKDKSSPTVLFSFPSPSTERRIVYASRARESVLPWQ
jgi:hypothetical protein